MGSPRFDVVFFFWQCDKKNHGWREGPPVTVLCQSFRSAGRAFTLRLNQFRTKKEYSFALLPANPHMPSKSTRIAYLKRMLKRLEGEDIRLQNLVSGGELTRQGAELAAQQLSHSRNELLAELRKLEPR